MPNVKDALETPAYIYTESAADEYRPKLSLGDDAKRTGKFSFAFFVKNVSDTEVTYTLSYDLISDAVVGDATEDRSDDALAGYARNLSGNVSFRDSDGMEIKTVTVPAGAEARVEAFVSLSKADMDYMDRYFENGTYAEGYIYLKNNENPDLLLSFMGFYGSWLDSPVFDAFLYDGRRGVLRTDLSVCGRRPDSWHESDGSFRRGGNTCRYGPLFFSGRKRRA